MPSTLYEVKDLDTSFWFNAYAGSGVGFQDLIPYPDDSGVKTGTKVCGFPGSACASADGAIPDNFPACMVDFLNNSAHPASGYNRILFRFFYPSGLTTQTQEVGTKVPVQKWRLYIEGQNQLGSCGQCSDCERHTITGDANGYAPYGATETDPYDMYIERTGPAHLGSQC